MFLDYFIGDITNEEKYQVKADLSLGRSQLKGDVNYREIFGTEGRSELQEDLNLRRPQPSGDLLRLEPYIMTSLAILCLAFTLLITRATQCGSGQHCPVCDNNGHCSEPCDDGYFGKTCLLECSSRCRDQLCELTDGGIEICTKGCVPGYMGTSCMIPCDKPETQCTVCESGCDGGYCWLSSTFCVFGCVDSFYGFGCKNCSERCESCNRSSGMCSDCHDPYRGLNCEMSCETCAGSCMSGCEEGCKPGFYGHWCDEVCSENCRPGPNKTVVMECDQNASTNCTSECHNNTGDCIHGCNDGWYGRNCSSRCSRKCANMSCTESGSCSAGCAPGHAGTDCSCLEKCFDQVCFGNGTCAKGCIIGYYGAFCNKSCDACLDGICEQTHGTCVRGCYITDPGCTPNCTTDCPLDVCLQVGTCSAGSQPKRDIKYVTIGLLAVILLTGIMCAFCFEKYRSKRRNDEADDYVVEYQPPSNTYYEIRDEDVDEECDSSEPGPSDVTPPLAGQLQVAFDNGTSSDVSSASSPEDNPSYTGLVNDNGVDAEPTCVYITPAAETTAQ
ncbi:platelet endothelial aggregation receptor 1-like [Haliotis asinina]|uniref:platelet endothelial aggregation receptor 1-like n=1 Tax=Haliotis asinina TaxID=109174 RepID=UPI0035320AF1